MVIRCIVGKGKKEKRVGAEDLTDEIKWLPSTSQLDFGALLHPRGSRDSLHWGYMHTIFTVDELPQICNL